MEENKFDIKKILLLSFGFFASTIAWSIYNAFVPQILEGFLQSTAMIGLIMTIDNVFGVIFQPLFGTMSDKTRTRFGRRMPYIIIGIPICVAALIFIPYMANLWSLMAVVIIFTFVMSAWRSPVVALMPDITPGPFRSQANGIVNLMGGVGALFAFAGGGLLFQLGGFPLPFLMSAIFMLLALFVLVVFVREPKQAYEPGEQLKKIKLNLGKSEKKSLILLLCGIFFWFTAYNAVETFFTLYATNTLLVDAGTAAMLLAVFSLSFVAFAVPAGIVGAKIGRKKTIMIGLVGLTALFIPLIFVTNIWAIRVLLLFGGLFWACININSLPMIVKLSGADRMGTFIGYYYFFSFSSQIVSPVLFGYIRDIIGNYQVLFVYSSIALIFAALCLFFVKHGEEDDPMVDVNAVLGGLGD